MVALTDGVALVTGGARGMGEATCRLFAGHGTPVMIGDLNEERGVALAAELSAKGHAAKFRKADVTIEDDVRALVAEAVEHFGRIDFAVNCAGLGNEPVKLADMTLADYERTSAINARGVFLCMKYEIGAMLNGGGGAIVNISSGAGMGGLPYQAAYCAAKHACIGLTRTAALEYADKNIRINAVAPGLIDTPLNPTGPFIDHLATLVPLKRKGTAREVAESCLWLCSDASSYVLGQVLGICGGLNRVSASGTMPGFGDFA